jgi:hypothetical protein
MKKLVLLVALFAAAPSFADDGGASEVSVRQLLDATKARALMEKSYAQLDGYMEKAMRQALGDTKLNEKQEQVMADFRKKTADVLLAEMSWEKLEPTFVAIYRKTLTQSEVDGMIKFYHTSAGIAVVDKMPRVMDETMRYLMDIMGAMGPKLGELQNQFKQDFEAASK